MRTVTLIVALFLVALVPGGPALAVDHDHLQVVGKICQTGVTPEAAAEHKEFVTALDRERTVEEFFVVGWPSGQLVRKVQLKKSAVGPWGRTTDFSGPRPLELAYLDCAQAR